MGIAVDALKYVPSDEQVPGYNTRIAQTISKESSERYGDRSYAFEARIVDYLIGNCDNHLKNLSLTWSSDWTKKSVSPLYDVTSTTVYPELSRDMGLGIGHHRSIDEIEPADFEELAGQLGLSAGIWRQALGELAGSFPDALLCAAQDLEVSHGVKVTRIAERILQEGSRRRQVALRAAG